MGWGKVILEVLEDKRPGAGLPWGRAALEDMSPGAGLP